MSITALKVVVSDQKDSARKVATVRQRTANDEAFAVMAALKIQAQPSLLEGLERVVCGIARHDKAAEVLANVFDAGADELYPSAYKAFLMTRFSRR